MGLLTFKQFLMEMPLAYQKQPEEHEKIWYHASPNEYDSSEILPMSHFGTKTAARGRAASFGLHKPNEKHVKANVMAYRLKLKKGWEIVDDGDEHLPHDIVKAMSRSGHITDDEHKELLSKVALPYSRREESYKHIQNFLQSKGVDHLYYKNAIEDKGSYSVIVVNPKETIRPIFQNRRGRINYARAEMADSSIAI